ncbi:A/G-specific adenine glycosylase [Cognatitamlana onchidii]|uniref:A/G-specific adenine glycosylase n=1 Tax=Cognatitamlana onchidii TaxID=2562860 RepID=UPI0010A64A00|nr:A/G-specific adenine glycosylase [Algibacter onchidii]
MIFSKTLIDWYSVNKRFLPWRETKNPYYIWLSEIILQQTQVKQGLPYYEAFVNEYPTVFDLAKAEESDVLKLWQGLGYYSRARNLHASAKFVAESLKGKFPNNYKDLLKLKGVGDYTASAIASICFNEAVAVVDGNVYRVLARFYGIETPINSSKGAKEFKNLAQNLIDAKRPEEFNQAIMEFGATHCKPQNPYCHECPFNTRCIAFNTNRIHELPVKIKLAKAKRKHFNFLVFISEDRKTILEKRQGKGIWQNLYQFPLIETVKELNANSFQNTFENYKLFTDRSYNYSLYNEKPIIHKLSHQHLYTKFWVVSVDRLPIKGLYIDKLEHFPVPVLIENFLKTFNFQ